MGVHRCQWGGVGVGVAATATAATSVLLMIVGFFYAFAQALGGGSVLIGFACIPVAWVGGLFALNYVVRGVLASTPTDRRLLN